MRYHIGLVIVSLCVSIIQGCGGNAVKPSFSTDVRIPNEAPDEVVLGFTSSSDDEETVALTRRIKASVASHLEIPVTEQCSKASCWVMRGRVSLEQGIEKSAYRQKYANWKAKGVSRVRLDVELQEAASSPFFTLSLRRDTEIKLTGPIEYAIESVDVLAEKLGRASADVMTNITVSSVDISGEWKNAFGGEVVSVQRADGKVDFVGKEDEVVERNGVRAKLGEIERFQIRGEEKASGNMRVFQGRIFTNNAVGTDPKWRNATFKLFGDTLIVSHIQESLIYSRI